MVGALLARGPATLSLIGAGSVSSHADAPPHGFRDFERFEIDHEHGPSVCERAAARPLGAAGRRAHRQDERGVRVAHVQFRADGHIGRIGLDQSFVAIGDPPVLGPSVARNPTANRDTRLERRVVRPAIDSRLPAGPDLHDSRHDGIIRKAPVRAACWVLGATCGASCQVLRATSQCPGAGARRALGTCTSTHSARSTQHRTWHVARSTARST